MNATRLLLTTALAVLLLGPAPDAPAQADPAAEVEALLDEARDLGAKGQLPLAWWDLDERLDAAREKGADPATWDALRRDATYLRNRAAFIDEMRRRRSGMEALLGRFDQALNELAALAGVELDPTLTGTRRAAALQDGLGRTLLRQRVRVDSLTVANRRLQETVGGHVVAQDSLVASLRGEVSALRRELWETELRAGVAEADRSAAEVVLAAKQQREDAIERLRTSFGEDEAEIMLTGDGAVVLRVHGLAFGVGSAQVAAGQEGLLARLADAVAAFPGAALAVEGHTDDTGSREANLRLSRRRAETVAVLLAENLGRGPDTIATEGYGPDRPVAPNSTAEGRARNRRIDLVIRPEP